MLNQRWMWMSVAAFGAAVAIAGCSKNKPAEPGAAAPGATTAPAAAKAPEAAPAAPANPVVAEFAPLFVDIAKCEDLSDLYAKEKCPANYKLLEAVIAAYEGVEKDKTRFEQVYGALVEQVVNGTDIKARKCAAYAAWSKGNRGGDLFADNEKVSLDLLGALAKMPKEDEYLGYETANMLGNAWKKDTGVRKALISAIKDKTILTTRGRGELIRHAGWVAAEVPDVLSAIRTVATDATDDIDVRKEGMSALGSVLKAKPEMIESLLFITAEPNVDAQMGAITAIASVTPATPEALKAQAKLVELLAATDPNPLASGILRSLGRFADLDGIKAATTYYAANAAKPGVASTYANMLSTLAYGGRFKDNPEGDAALRGAAESVLKGADSKPSDKDYALQALGALGGPKSVAACKKFSADAEKSVAAAAAKCVQKASAPAPAK